MQSLLRILLVSLFVSATSCGDGGSSSKSPKRSFVTIDGTFVYFDTSLHGYYWAADETLVVLTDSTPPEWYVEFYWPGDGATASADTALGEIVVFVDPPPGAGLYTADASTAQRVVVQFTKWGSSMGDPVEGFFDGGVERTWPSDPTDTLLLEDGWFRAVRRN